MSPCFTERTTKLHFLVKTRTLGAKCLLLEHVTNLQCLTSTHSCFGRRKCSATIHTMPLTFTKFTVTRLNGLFLFTHRRSGEILESGGRFTIMNSMNCLNLLLLLLERFMLLCLTARSISIVFFSFRKFFLNTRRANQSL